jgi:hypothetical protein
MLRVHSGGEIRHGRKGAEYSIRPRFTLMATSEQCWYDVKCEIHRQLGYSESEYNLKTLARVNVGTTTRRYYEILEIVCDQTWRGIYEQSMLARTQYSYVDLYIELVPIVGSMQSQLFVDSMVPETQSEHVHNQYNASQAGPSLFQPYQTPQIPRRDLYLSPYPDVNEVSPPVHAYTPPVQANNQESPWVEPPRVGDPCNDADDVPQSDDEDDADSCEEDADWDTGAESEGDVSPDTQGQSQTPRVHGRQFSLSDRGTSHPVRSFTDTSGFQEADVPFFSRTQHIHDPLGVGKEYSSKDALRLAINDYHIRNNIEVKTTSSNRTQLTVDCKDSRCIWRLYAKSGLFSSKWEIKTIRAPHTCHADASRTDHAQLTAEMIAEVVRQDIREDVTLNIRNIKGLVRKKYGGVTPKYNKLWRGRELAIAQIFGSWAGSYNLLTPVLEAIKRSTPGTKYGVAHEPTEDPGKRLFRAAVWAYGPCIAAVPHLRPIISIDACFLSGRYQGRLLMA